MRTVVRLLIALVLAPAVAQAQETEPLLEVRFEEAETIPGQPLDLRLTVLVPTFMPKPVAFPSMNAPNLIVERVQTGTGPTSERVEGETWSGVNQRYRVTPLAAGTFALPGGEVVVTFADPQTRELTQTTLTLDAITLTATVPEGAEGLDPFIAATALELTQTIEGTPETPLKAGETIVRTVEATIKGAPAILIPQLMAPLAIDGIAAYPAEPAFTQEVERGVVSGTRRESLTLVAESGGTGTIAPITLDWYNLESETVERASVAGFEVVVDAPVAASADAGPKSVLIVLALGAVLFLTVIGVFLAPRLRQETARMARAWQASEAHAYRQVRSAIKAPDVGALSTAAPRWLDRLPREAARDEALGDAFAALGRHLYREPASADASPWTALARTAARVHKNAKRRPERRTRRQLPPLNPQRSNAPL